MRGLSLSIERVGRSFSFLTRSSLRLLLATCLTGGIARAQEFEGAPVLTLDEAIATAVESNFGLRIERLDPLIQQENVIIEEAAFDSLLFANGRYTSSEQDVRGTTSEQRSYSAGVRKQVATGAVVTAQTSLARNDGTFYNPELGQIVGGNLSQNADIALSVTQPLLRGFGIDVTLAELRRAEALDRATRLELRSVMLDVLRDTELAYWGVADAIARRRLGESNRELAQQLLEETQQRSELGLATRLELLQAEANLAAREQEIIAAEQLLSERTDALVAMLGSLSEEQDLDPRIRVARLPEVAPGTPEFREVWQEALMHNPETAIQEEAILIADLDLLSARDANRPQLDVTLSGAFNGLSDESGTEAYRQALERDGYEWGGQVTFSYPFGRRASQAVLRQAKYRKEQAEWALMELKQSLLQEVRSAWRALDVARRQLHAAELTVRLQEASYEQERSRYEEGLSTTRAVLEAQRDLDTARASLLDARFDALTAEIRLERAQGLLTERHQLSWEAIAPEALTSR